MKKQLCQLSACSWININRNQEHCKLKKWFVLKEYQSQERPPGALSSNMEGSTFFLGSIWAIIAVPQLYLPQAAIVWCDQNVSDTPFTSS
jgi:hypothetical protein